MKVTTKRSIFQELAELFASCPTREEMIGYRPSPRMQQRARKLLRKRKEGQPLSDSEQAEFEDFLRVEMFMGLLKAQLRVREAPRP